MSKLIHSLKIGQNLFSDLKKELLKDSPLENAAFLLLGINKLDDEIQYLARRLITISGDGFRIKNNIHLDIQPNIINGIVSLCEANGMGLAVCHSHPEAIDHLEYSPSDDFGENRLSRFFWENLPEFSFISLLLGPKSLKGRVWIKKKRITKPLNSISLIGARIEKNIIDDGQEILNIDEEVFDRQIQAFGLEGQQKISSKKIGIVGVGGVGSSVAEQLVRLGIKDLIIMDKDRYHKSNLTRMYGSKDKHKHTWKFWGTQKSFPKVDLIKEHLLQINPSMNIKAKHENIVLRKSAELMLDRDIIFSCTDDHWGRSIINQISYQYLIPTINIGMRIDTNAELVSSGVVVIHILRPDNPCLWCYEYLKGDIIAAESLPKEDRIQLIRENYVQNINSPAPSVLSFTTLGASMGLNLFLHMATGYMGNYGNYSSLGYDIFFGDVRRRTTNIKEDCICKRNLAFGDMRSLNTIEDRSLLPSES